MATQSLKRNIQQYRSLMTQLEEQQTKLMQQRKQADLHAYVMVDGDSLTEQSSYHTEANSLLLASVEKQLEIIKIKAERIAEVSLVLQEIYAKDPRQQTPAQLSFKRFEEWMARNKVLLALHTSLYEIEELKYSLMKRRRVLKDHFASKIPSKEALVQNMGDILSKLDNAASFAAPSSSSKYLENLLAPHEENSTIESQHISSYVKECHQVGGTLQSPCLDSHGNVKGVHPQRYHEVVEVLSNFILQKEVETQQDEILTQEEVFLAIELVVMPQIKQKVMKFIESSDEDQWLYQQSIKYADITLDQLGVAKRLQSDELVPFAQSIACLQSSFFTTNPTTKMLSVLSAAKALYVRLQNMGQATNLDADSFLDIWIYVIIKAGIQDLATTLTFMSEYSNPLLCHNEAGYYLTTLQVAIQFISNLKPEMLQIRVKSLSFSTSTEFIICEQEKISKQGNHFEVLEKDKLLTGYQIGVIKEWVLQPWRLYCSVLVKTNNDNDAAKVTVFKLCDTASHSQLNFVRSQYCCFQEVALALYSEVTPLGNAVVINKEDTGMPEIEILPEGGNFDAYFPSIFHKIQLIRLGSERVDCEAASLLTDINSTSGYCRKSKCVGSRVVIEAEVYHQNKPQSTNQKHNCYHSHSNNEKVQKKHEEIELHYTKLPNQNDNVTIISESKFISGPVASLEPGISESSTSQLESNFLQNYYSHCNGCHDDIYIAVANKIKEAQVYLHRLGYLSHVIQVDGVYTDFVLEAVKKFQCDFTKQSTADNLDPHIYVSLPTNGYLTVFTFVCLARHYFNVHNALTRKGADLPDIKHMDKDSLALFKTFVKHFQECESLKDCIPGHLCAKTMAKLLEFVS